MRKLRNIYLAVILRTGMAVVGLLLIVTIISTTRLAAQDQCLCKYPLFTSLLDEGKCKPLVCTETDIAITCEVAEPNQTTTFNFLYLVQKTSNFAICKTLTDPGSGSSPSVIMENFFPPVAEVGDCQDTLYQACL